MVDRPARLIGSLCEKARRPSSRKTLRSRQAIRNAGRGDNHFPSKYDAVAKHRRELLTTRHFRGEKRKQALPPCAISAGDETPRVRTVPLVNPLARTVIMALGVCAVRFAPSQ